MSVSNGDTYSPSLIQISSQAVSSNFPNFGEFVLVHNDAKPWMVAPRLYGNVRLREPPFNFSVSALPMNFTVRMSPTEAVASLAPTTVDTPFSS